MQLPPGTLKNQNDAELLFSLETETMRVYGVDTQEASETCGFCLHPGCRYVYIFSEKASTAKQFVLGSTCGLRLANAVASGQINSVADFDAARLATYAAHADKLLREAIALREKIAKRKARLDDAQPYIATVIERFEKLWQLYHDAKNSAWQSEMLWQHYHDAKSAVRTELSESAPRWLRRIVSSLFNGHLPSIESVKSALALETEVAEIAELEARAEEMRAGTCYLFG